MIRVAPSEPPARSNARSLQPERYVARAVVDHRSNGPASGDVVRPLSRSATTGVWSAPVTINVSSPPSSERSQSKVHHRMHLVGSGRSGASVPAARPPPGAARSGPAARSIAASAPRTGLFSAVGSAPFSSMSPPISPHAEAALARLHEAFSPPGSAPGLEAAGCDASSPVLGPTVGSKSASCEHCEASFEPTRRSGQRQRYCSPLCRKRAHLARRKAMPITSIQC